jgi:hypothetical protein
MPPRVRACDPAHGPKALSVEDSQPLAELLGQAPALGAIEEDGEDKAFVDSALCLP